MRFVSVRVSAGAAASSVIRLPPEGDREERIAHQLFTQARDDRGVLRLVVVIPVLLLVACGASPTHPDWSGPAELRPSDGMLEVDEFRAHADAVDEEWERDPEALAREYLGGLEGEVSLDGTQVTLLRDDLQDDSVEAERFVLELEQNDESWKLVSARWEQRCHAGRGHQVFSPELCV